MTHTTMTGGTIKINTDQTVGIGELNLTGKAEVDQGMNKITEEEILEAILDHIRISEDRIAEENTDVIIGMTVTVEIEVGVNLEKGHFQETIAIIEGMIEVQAIVDQGQDQEQVLIGIELDIINVESMITLQKIALHPMKRGKWNKSNKCSI